MSASAQLPASSAQGPDLLRSAGRLCGEGATYSPASVHIQSTCCGSSLWTPVSGQHGPAKHRESRLEVYCHPATPSARCYGPAEARHTNSCLRSALSGANFPQTWQLSRPCFLPWTDSCRLRPNRSVRAQMRASLLLSCSLEGISSWQEARLRRLAI